MRKRTLVSLGLLTIAQVLTFELTRAQSVEFSPPAPTMQMQVDPISTGGSLVTIQAPIQIDLPSIDTQRISDISLKRIVPNLPADARVVEVKNTDQPGKSQVIIRDNADEWRGAGPSSIQPAPQSPVLWLATAGSEEDYKLLTQLVPPDSGQNSWGWPEVGPFAIHSAGDVGSLAALFSDNPQLIIINHHGQLLPRDWFQAIKNSGRPYAIVTRESPNQDFLAAKSAAELGDQGVRPDAVSIVSALPKLDGWLSGYWELYRMNLEIGQRDAWEKLLSNIKSESLPAAINEATSESLRNELLYGNNDFVFVIAHNDGHFVYLPGSGGAISYDEFLRTRRSDAPNRTIVLVTCNGGTRNASPRSLADIFLQNKLAKTVFASQTDIDANDVPALLRELLVGGEDTRDTLIRHGYFQFVIRLAWANPDV